MEDHARRDTGFFGHPKGLGVLAGTEMWERFSFYGMQALLMLYMTQYLLKPENAAQVWGMTGYRSALETLFGPMTDLAFAAQTFGLYSGFIYLTPLIGAWLGDRVLGITRTVTIGALLMSAGHLAMAYEQSFLIALLLLISGAGCLLGNMASQVGLLYPPGDERRTRAFGVYLIALNVGGLVAPLVCGTLGEAVGWHWGFGAAGVGMLIGLVTYLAGRRHLPPDRITRRGERTKLTRGEWRRITGILLVFLPYILTATAAMQAYGIMLVWADESIDHSFFGWEMPITWVLTFDGVMTIAGVMLATRIWKRAAVRGREPTDVMKLGIGSAGIMLSFLFLAGVATMASAPISFLILFFIIFDLTIGWIEAPTASLTSAHAPAPVNAMMMALFKLARAFSYFLLGWLGRFFEPLGPSLYWVLTGAIAGLGLMLILVLRGGIARLLAQVPPSASPPAVPTVRPLEEPAAS